MKMISYVRSLTLLVLLLDPGSPRGAPVRSFTGPMDPTGSQGFWPRPLRERETRIIPAWCALSKSCQELRLAPDRERFRNGDGGGGGKERSLCRRRQESDGEGCDRAPARRAER
jgi:hypothetical protein